MLKIREFADTGGVLSAIHLLDTDGVLKVGNEAASVALPEKALAVVMARNGAPVEAPSEVDFRVRSDGIVALDPYASVSCPWPKSASRLAGR